MSNGYWQFELTLPISEGDVDKLAKLYDEFGQKKWAENDFEPSADEMAGFADEIALGGMSLEEFTPQVHASGFSFAAGEGWKKGEPHLYIDNADDGEWCDPSSAAEFLQAALIEMDRDDVVEFECRHIPFGEMEADAAHLYKVSKSGIEELDVPLESAPPAP